MRVDSKAVVGHESAIVLNILDYDALLMMNLLAVPDY